MLISIKNLLFVLAGKKNKSDGYTLVEILVAIAIMGIFFVAIFSIFSMVLRNSVISESRITATGLANQQLEMIRNLTYDDVATTEGWPQGDIPSSQVKTLNNINYTINTEVIYFDDPYDSLVPVDTLGSDFKKVKVEVTWDKYESGTPVVLYTDVSPRGTEEEEQPGGVLSVQVFDYNNQPVIDASIAVSNTNLGINFNGTTNNEGERLFYSVTPDPGSNYAVQITKGGYTSDYTSKITASLPDPENPHVPIFEGEISETSFIIDLVSSLHIAVQDSNDPPSSLADVSLDIVGERRLGLDGENQPVIRNKFEGEITDGNGDVNLSDIEWDNYTISENHVDYDLAEINPPNPVIVSPNENKAVVLTLADHADNTLRVVVLDSGDNPIEDASVRIYSSTYDETQQTSSAGQVFFTPLITDTYTLEVTKSGYVDVSDSVDVVGQTVNETVLAIQS